MEQKAGNIGELTGLPAWVPDAARRYLVHTERGLSIRAIARRADCHPSTVLRQVRRLENLRDDFLIDEALRRLGRGLNRDRAPLQDKEPTNMTLQGSVTDLTPDDETLKREARRVLRRLCEPGAVLAVAAEMDKAVVVRDGADGNSTRTAVVERAVAQAMALKDWISCSAPGRITRYHITAAGRSALNRMLAEAENAAVTGFAEAQSPFAAQHRTWGEKEVTPETGGPRRKLRYNLGESPLTALARRRDRDGAPFLADELVAAGERLREDFELAQMGPRTTQNWEGLLTGAVDGGGAGGPGGGIGGPGAARARVAAALRDLGPGLGDVVLRCCCFLEGLEQAEKRMGWSARSGKIVLRIALQRLKRHYQMLGAEAGMIG